MANNAGQVVLYPYLWQSQRDDGETEGRKKRPACLVLRMHDKKQALHHLVILAISSKPPGAGQKAIEIPDTERKRAGLSRYPRAWIVVSEYNYDIEELSYYYEPGEPLGAFSAPFLRQIAMAVQSALKTAGARIDRIR
jgi:hypothetical protein